jgi:hypothetical protein
MKRTKQSKQREVKRSYMEQELTSKFYMENTGGRPCMYEEIFGVAIGSSDLWHLRPQPSTCQGRYECPRL